MPGGKKVPGNQVPRFPHIMQAWPRGPIGGPIVRRPGPNSPGTLLMRVQLQTMGFIILNRPLVRIKLVSEMIMKKQTGELFSTKKRDGFSVSQFLFERHLV